MEKTYKREVAFLLLIFWAVLIVWGIYNPEAKEASRFATLPIFSFAFGAWGFDAWAKQIIPASKAS